MLKKKNPSKPKPGSACVVTHFIETHSFWINIFAFPDSAACPGSARWSLPYLGQHPLRKKDHLKETAAGRFSAAGPESTALYLIGCMGSNPVSRRDGAGTTYPLLSGPDFAFQLKMSPARARSCGLTGNLCWPRTQVSVFDLEFSAQNKWALQETAQDSFFKIPVLFVFPWGICNFTSWMLHYYVMPAAPSSACADRDIPGCSGAVWRSRMLWFLRYFWLEGLFKYPKS